MEKQTSSFLEINKADLKHLAVEAALTGALGAIGVITAYLSGHDVGTLGPVLVMGTSLLASLLKKLLTNHEGQ